MAEIQEAPTLEIQLPQGPQFRLITRVTEVSSTDQSATAELHFTGEEIYKASDHFPGNTILAGNLLLEGMCQTAEQIVRVLPEFQDHTIYLTGYRDVKFRYMVLPGETVTFKAWISHLRPGRGGRAKAEAYVDNERVASIEEIGFLLEKE